MFNAIESRCTIGEISSALENKWGRYQAGQQTAIGVYKGNHMDKTFWEETEKKYSNFEKENGRRPRMLIAKMGQDGHDRGAKVIASSFSDAGFDIDLAPMFSTPKEVARQAVDNDVHLIGVSSQAAGHKTLIPELVKELQKLNAEDIIVIAGGVIPQKDYQFLYDAGVPLIFRPGTAIPDAVEKILSLLKK